MNPLNYLNKFDIRSISVNKDEAEVLLYPYFTFKVDYIRPKAIFDYNNIHIESMPVIVVSEIATDWYSFNNVNAINPNIKI